MMNMIVIIITVEQWTMIYWYFLLQVMFAPCFLNNINKIKWQNNSFVLINNNVSKVSIREKTLMQKLTNGSILFIFNKKLL